MSLPIPSEHQEQVALIQWAKLNSKKYPALQFLFAIPNGGDRNAIVGKKLKAEGARAGVPDLFLPAANGIGCGLFIELKRTDKKPKRGGKGGVAPEQQWWINELMRAGYSVAVCYGWREAAEVIEEYLSFE